MWPTRAYSLTTCAIAGLCLLVGIGLWKSSGKRIAVVRQPRGVMGTTCTLVAVVSQYDQDMAHQTLREAEAELRRIEARMSSWIEVSEVSQLNNAVAGEDVVLSPPTRDVLRAARRAYEETDGAFDVTCRPLIELWRAAGKRGTLPTDGEIRDSRAASQWDKITLVDASVQKHTASTRIDLGGIAKGYAIDAAVEVVRRAGIEDGYVEIGGDERFMGRDASGALWSVAVQNPFGDGVLLELEAGKTAVCTSGNYARFVEINGEGYGHIIDPRTGRPVTEVASVTVMAPTAMTADIWATALSVLGPSGLRKLPLGVDALIVTGSSEDVQRIATPGMQARLP